MQFFSLFTDTGQVSLLFFKLESTKTACIGDRNVKREHLLCLCLSRIIILAFILSFL